MEEIKKIQKIPSHVAVIMDGNGRWAKARGLERTEGHKAGEEALMRWVRAGRKLGIKEMSFYTFSTENWNRSPAEVRFLMNLSKEIMRKRAPEFIELGCQVKWIGRKTRLWKSVLKELDIIQTKTKNCKNMKINFCINYGGRAEIVDAVENIIDQVKAGKLKGKVTEKSFSHHLYDSNMRDVDLMIRTSGEIRLSNFLLWELAYSEMVFIEDAWPDVNEDTLVKCLLEYQSRDRRFGKA
ncbi:MAG: di-trans,poly-cis-decaprenylcistransferase [Candidatus Ancillula sp.]|jgi:undecaprenyl diphosphate synthase|nr:di-trans,poly-cis-decaprenylcistransferase [Candidatus Ancillula sp.]